MFLKFHNLVLKGPRSCCSVEDQSCPVKQCGFFCRRGHIEREALEEELTKKGARSMRMKVQAETDPVLKPSQLDIKIDIMDAAVQFAAAC